MRQCNLNILINQKPYLIENETNDPITQADYDRSILFDTFYPKMMEWLKKGIIKEQIGSDILEYQYRILELNNLIYLALAYKGANTKFDISCVITKYRKLWAEEGFYLNFISVLSSIGVDYVSIINSGNVLVPVNPIELENSNSDGFVLIE